MRFVFRKTLRDDFYSTTFISATDSLEDAPEGEDENDVENPPIVEVEPAYVTVEASVQSSPEPKDHEPSNETVVKNPVPVVAVDAPNNADKVSVHVEAVAEARTSNVSADGPKHEEQGEEKEAWVTVPSAAEVAKSSKKNKGKKRKGGNANNNDDVTADETFQTVHQSASESQLSEKSSASTSPSSDVDAKNKRGGGGKKPYKKKGKGMLLERNRFFFFK